MLSESETDINEEESSETSVAIVISGEKSSDVSVDPTTKSVLSTVSSAPALISTLPVILSWASAISTLSLVSLTSIKLEISFCSVC